MATTHKFRTDPFTNLFTDVKVDKENGILRGIRVIEAGEAKGHNVLIDDISLSSIANLGSRGQIKSRFGHPGMSGTALGTYLGTVENIRLDNGLVVGDLHLDKNVASTSPNGDLYTYILNLAESAPSQAGASIVCEADLSWKGADGAEYAYEAKPTQLAYDKPFLRPVTLDAVDLVDEPAATSGMFSSSNLSFDPSVLEQRDSALSEKVFAQLDSWLSQVNVPPEKAREFANRYFSWRVDGNHHIPLTLTGKQLKEVSMSIDTVHPEDNDVQEPPVAMEAAGHEEVAMSADDGDYIALLSDAVVAVDERIVALEAVIEQYALALAELQAEMAQLEIKYNAEPEVTLTLSANAALPSKQADKLASIAGRPRNLGSVAPSKVQATTPVDTVAERKAQAFSKIAQPPKAKGINPVSLLRTAMGQGNNVEVI